MKKLTAILLTSALLLALTACNSKEEASEQTETPQTEANEITIQGTDDASEPQPTVGELTWILEPTLPHESIIFCTCSSFVNQDNYLIDERTGELGEMHPGHGAGTTDWVYDPSEDLFGNYMTDAGWSELTLHPLSEFADWFPDAANMIIIVKSIDSSIKTEEEWGVNLPEEAYSDKVAVMYGGKFVTDFEYDRLRFGANGGRHMRDFTALVKDGKHGIVDKTGEIILPFILDDLLVIDNDTAFAKQNGRYGIISISGNTPDPASSWKQLYINQINEAIDEFGEDLTFSLVYIDDNDIPELIIHYPYMAAGGELFTVNGGKLVSLLLSRGSGISYIERGGIFLHSDGHMGSYYDMVYTLEKGEFTEIVSGSRGEHMIDYELVIECYWDGQDVSEEEYNRSLDSAFDKANAAFSWNNTYSPDEIFDVVRNN